MLPVEDHTPRSKRSTQICLRDEFVDEVAIEAIIPQDLARIRVPSVLVGNQEYSVAIAALVEDGLRWAPQAATSGSHEGADVRADLSVDLLESLERILTTSITNKKGISYLAFLTRGERVEPRGEPFGIFRSRRTCDKCQDRARANREFANRQTYLVS